MKFVALTITPFLISLLACSLLNLFFKTLQNDVRYIISFLYYVLFKCFTAFFVSCLKHI